MVYTFNWKESGLGRVLRRVKDKNYSAFVLILSFAKLDDEYVDKEFLRFLLTFTSI